MQDAVAIIKNNTSTISNWIQYADIGNLRLPPKFEEAMQRSNKALQRYDSQRERMGQRAQISFDDMDKIMKPAIQVLKTMTDKEWAQVPGIGAKVVLLREMERQLKPTAFWAWYANRETASSIDTNTLMQTRLLTAAYSERYWFELFKTSGTEQPIRNYLLQTLPTSLFEKTEQIADGLIKEKKGIKQLESRLYYHAPEDEAHFSMLTKWLYSIDGIMKEYFSAEREDLAEVNQKMYYAWKEAPDHIDDPGFIPLLLGEQPPSFSAMAHNLASVFAKNRYPSHTRDIAKTFLLTHSKLSPVQEQKIPENDEFRLLMQRKTEFQHNLMSTIINGNQIDKTALKALANAMGTEDFITTILQLARDRMMLPVPESPEWGLNPYVNEAIQLRERNYDINYGETVIYAGHRLHVLPMLQTNIGQILENPEEAEKIGSQFINMFDTRRLLLPEMVMERTGTLEDALKKTLENRFQRLTTTRVPFSEVAMPRIEDMDALREQINGGKETLLNMQINKQIFTDGIQAVWDDLRGPNVNYALYAVEEHALEHHVDFTHTATHTKHAEKRTQPKNALEEVGIEQGRIFYLASDNTNVVTNLRWSALGVFDVGVGEAKFKVSAMIKEGKTEVFIPFEPTEPGSTRDRENEAIKLLFEAVITHTVHDMLIRDERRVLRKEQKEPEQIEQEKQDRQSSIRLVRYVLTPDGLASHDKQSRSEIREGSEKKSFPMTVIPPMRVFTPYSRPYWRAIEEFNKAKARLKETLSLEERAEEEKRIQEASEEIGKTKRKKTRPIIKKYETAPMKMLDIPDPRDAKEQAGEPDYSNLYPPITYVTTWRKEKKMDDVYPIDELRQAMGFPANYVITSDDAMLVGLNANLTPMLPEY